MGRIPVVPSELTKGPFEIALARRHGVSKQQLRGASWRPLGAGIYASRGIVDDPMTWLIAVNRRLRVDAAFSGRTAAWLHGLDVVPRPIEVTLPAQSCVSRIAGVRVRRSDLNVSEVSMRNGMRVTSRLRTCADLGRREPLADAVALIDMATHIRWTTVRHLNQWAEVDARNRGVRRLRRVLELVEPATESPMETRLRLLLIQAGLPRPEVQVPLRDGSGFFIGRPDLFYPRERVAIEYDGSSHRDRLGADNRRQNRLIDAGYRILRFTATDVLSSPDSVVDLVRRSLSAC